MSDYLDLNSNLVQSGLDQDYGLVWSGPLLDSGLAWVLTLVWALIWPKLVWSSLVSGGGWDSAAE